MGRFRKKMRKRLGEAQLSVSDADAVSAARVFALEGCVHLSDDVVAGLVTRGWPDAKLREFRERGGHYCEPRDSIIFPTPSLLAGAPVEVVMRETVKETTFKEGRLLDHFHSLALG